MLAWTHSKRHWTVINITYKLYFILFYFIGSQCVYAMCASENLHKCKKENIIWHLWGKSNVRQRSFGVTESHFIWTFIDADMPRFAEPIANVTVSIGRDALLACVVENLKGYKVAWVRVDTQTILSIHHNVISQNNRISLTYNDHRSVSIRRRYLHLFFIPFFLSI